MSHPHGHAHGAPLPDNDPRWVCLRTEPARGPVAEAGFVLTAVQIDNVVRETVDGWTLWVHHDDAARAEAELRGYRHEAAEETAPPPPAPAVDKGFAGVAGFLLVIWAIPFLQGSAPFGDLMSEAGRNFAGLVRAGEWWRVVTALTLHADSGHILSNSAFGALFGIYVGRALGSGVGWLAILLAGAGGNAVNSLLIQADAFRSIGASTATFGALGVYAGCVWIRGEIRRGAGWRRAVAPLFAGFALVVWTGTGGENTDVAAHFTGFGCGVALGVAAGRLPRAVLALPVQILAGAGALALVALAWVTALG
jgi:membrane associated rhomboid family serine protease